MAEAYWTYCMYCRGMICGCMYCRGMICGVEILEDNDDVLILYAHRQCHRERNCVDPHATWQMLCESLYELNANLNDKNARARAVDLLEIMARWLRMGGFPPKLA
jgi:hypothetical protein